MRARAFLFFPVLLILLAACGGSANRASLAKAAVTTYWKDVNSAKLDNAYALLTPGIQQSRPKSAYRQDMLGFLSTVGSVTPSVSKPSVNGDRAVVPVLLTFSRQQKTLEAYQHLYWYNGGWRITDENGGVSQTK